MNDTRIYVEERLEDGEWVKAPIVCGTCAHFAGTEMRLMCACECHRQEGFDWLGAVLLIGTLVAFAIILYLAWHGMANGG